VAGNDIDSRHESRGECSMRGDDGANATRHLPANTD
jgi:hypothetical protein